MKRRLVRVAGFALMSIAATIGIASPAHAIGAGQFCSPSDGGSVGQGANGSIVCSDSGANGAFRWEYARRILG